MNDRARRKDVHKSCRRQERWRVQWKECDNAPQKEIVATLVAFVGERTLNTDGREHDSKEKEELEVRNRGRQRSCRKENKCRIHGALRFFKRGSSFDVYKLLISNTNL